MPYDDHALPSTTTETYTPRARREVSRYETDTPWPGVTITPAERVARAVIVIVLGLMIGLTIWAVTSGPR